MGPDDAKHYEPMPAELLALIEVQKSRAIANATEVLAELQTMSPLEFAAANGVVLVEVPDWVDRIVGCLIVPMIQPYPSKSPGKWRVHSNSREWYIDHERIVEAIEGEASQ